MRENEMVMLLLCVGVFIFLVLNLNRLRKTRNFNILFTSFLFFLIACFMTVIEGFFLSELCNLLEHLCCAASSMVLLIWCLIIFKTNGEKK